MRSETVTALVRGLTLLQGLSSGGVQSIRQLHAATGLPKPTIVRLLNTMIEAGYVFVTDNAPAYGVTAKVLSLAEGFELGRHLTQRLGATVRRFQQSIPWPSDLAVFDGDSMVILETSRQPGVLSVNRRVGARVDATRTALGRAFTAFMPEAMQDAWTMRLPDTERCEYYRRLEHIRERGYAISDCENLPTIRALAAPVLQAGHAVASLNVIVVADAMGMADIESRYASPLLQATREMSDLLGSARDP